MCHVGASNIRNNKLRLSRLIIVQSRRKRAPKREREHYQLRFKEKHSDSKRSVAKTFVTFSRLRCRRSRLGRHGV